MVEAEDHVESHGSFTAYWRCLREHKEFRLLWTAEVIDNVGAWLNYVATLSLVEQFSGGGGLALSGVVLIRFLPSLVLAPVTGVVADRLNRLRVFIVMALAASVSAAALATVHEASQIYLLYFLLFTQFCAISFQDPARKALLPVTVPQRDLHLATTLDTFAWSLTGAVGASLGGVVASRLGNATCFLIDALTYLLAAGCAALVPRAMGDPGSASKQVAGQAGRAAQGGGSLELIEAPTQFLPAAEGDGWALGIEGAAQHHKRRSAEAANRDLAGAAAGHGSSGRTGGSALGHDYVAYHKESDAAEIQVHHDSGEESGLVGQIGAGGSSGSHAPGAGGGAGVAAAAAAAWREGVRALFEGWSYLCSQDNRDVAVLVTIKACAALVWGAVDILNVKFSEMPTMQALGDAQSTLGYVFGVVGLGCFLGPLAMNRLVPPRPGPLLWGIVASFALGLVGYALMWSAPNIGVVLASTFVRAIGSASLWVYSSLLLQLRVDNSILGRMCAVEMCLFTVCEAVSSMATGASFDIWHVGVRSICAVLAAIQAVVTLAWATYAYRHAGSRSLLQRQRSGPSYQPVPAGD